ncbi:MAG: hypothetical protein EGP10_00160 [SAR202 cluster bacterium]|nr:MAG: hypothetical protein EGP10_00160 [SAR202 cluster bacterium]
MKFFIAVFFLMVLTACAVQTEEIEESVQELVSSAISLPIIPTAQSVEALTVPTETPTEVPPRDVVETSRKFVPGEATALVKERIRKDLHEFPEFGFERLVQLEGDGYYSIHDLFNDQVALRKPCLPLVLFVFGLKEADVYDRDGDKVRNRYQKRLWSDPINFREVYSEVDQAWVVTLESEPYTIKGEVFDRSPTWKVYESTGTVEKVGIQNRDYC